MRKVLFFLILSSCLLSVCFAEEVNEPNLTQEFTQLQTKAENGDPNAQLLLGDMYRVGDNVKQDYEKTAHWYRKAAEQGIAEAQFKLGVSYTTGRGVPQDYTKSAEWYRKAAEQGIAEAQHLLGLSYYNGQGVPQDYTKAAEWFRKAAEQGLAEAQYLLGVQYANGQGVPQDYTKSAEWYRKAAEQGDAVAQYNLGVLYDNGRGVPQDYKKGVKWYRKAAEQGYAKAQYNLGVQYDNGYGVPQDYTKTVEWFGKAAEQGYAAAQCSLGLSYANGHGVPQDYTKAAEWFRKAAEQGYAAAQYNLGISYYNGQGVPQDYTKSAEWFRKAAEQGLAEAQYNLGVQYANGQGVPQDYTKAAEWYRKAAEQGYAAAQGNLGILYYTGRGVIEDYVEAYKWALLAGKNGLDYSKISDFKAKLQRVMTPPQIAQAQQLAKKFVAKNETNSMSNKPANISETTSYGTGFFVSSNGYVVTAAHVVEDATQIKLLNQNTNTSAQVVYKDEAIDVAVLKADKINASFLPIISSSKIETGEEVFTLGFPQIQIQGYEPKYTKGSINSLSGMGGNQRFFQISIPVQPGNSGGPLINSKGQVVGVIAARLDEIATLMYTGAIPQNVNYAIKSSFVLPFLDTLPAFNPHKKAMPDKRTELIDEAKKSVVLVLCH